MAWVVGGLAGRVAGGAPGTVAVVGGGPGAIVAPGCGAREPADGPAALVVVGPRLGAGTVDVELGTFGPVVMAADEPDSSSLTTSLWASTAAGRSVTSAATIDVAAHTTAVDATVTTSQSPAASNLDNGTPRECPVRTGPRAKETLNRHPPRRSASRTRLVR